MSSLPLQQYLLVTYKATTDVPVDLVIITTDFSVDLVIITTDFPVDLVIITTDFPVDLVIITTDFPVDLVTKTTDLSLNLATASTELPLGLVQGRYRRTCTAVCLFVCLFAAERPSPSNMQMYLRDGSAQTFLRCCHTEIEVADQTFHLTQSQYTDTGLTSPSTDLITPGAW